MIRAAVIRLAVLAAVVTAPVQVTAQASRDPVPLPGAGIIGSLGPANPVPPSAAPSVQRTGSDSVAIGAPGAVKGAATINGAAGINNQQANVGILALGENALTMGEIFEFTRDAAGHAGGNARATIAPGTLAGSSGWLAVSGAAGADNKQANLAIMALGTEGLAVSDTTLAQARASTKPMGNNGAADASPSRSVAIGQGAFKDSSGVVQLSLVGGDRNTSANSFALLVAGTAKPE